MKSEIPLGKRQTSSKFDDLCKLPMFSSYNERLKCLEPPLWMSISVRVIAPNVSNLTQKGNLLITHAIGSFHAFLHKFILTERVITLHDTRTQNNEHGRHF